MEKEDKCICFTFSNSKLFPLCSIWHANARLLPLLYYWQCRIKLKTLKLIKFLEFFIPSLEITSKQKRGENTGLFGEKDTVSKMWIKFIPPSSLYLNWEHFSSGFDCVWYLAFPFYIWSYSWKQCFCISKAAVICLHRRVESCCHAQTSLFLSCLYIFPDIKSL